MSIRQGRILLVDDDPEWREVLSEAIQRAGYAVETAATSEEAKQKCIKTSFHLVILDIRMQANDQTNREGIALLRFLKQSPAAKSLKIIMLSAYNTLPDMRVAFKEEVVDVLNKTEFDNNIFINEIASIFADRMEINFDLEINWQNVAGPDKVVQGLEIAGEHINKYSPHLYAISSELEELLCRLFWDAKSILVRRLTAGYSGTGVLSVQPVYKDGAARAVIVKYGDSQKIGTEYTNSKAYAERYVGGARSTKTLGVQYTLHLGGITYSLLGAADDRMQSFGTFYQQGSVTQIKEVLHGLFKRTCSAWYANPGVQYTLDLSKSYSQNLNFTWEKLSNALAESLKSVQGKEKLTFNALKINGTSTNERRFTNPISATDGKKAFFTTYTCITHGDFNQNNILIDNHSQSWLIDFQETGPGHILRDIVALDVEIRCKLLLPDEATLNERLAMEEALYSVDRFSHVSQLVGRFQTQNPALARTYELVIYLRELAYSLLPSGQDDDMTEYYTALLYNMLNSSRFRTISTGQREHALLSASLLVDKLGLTERD